MKKAIILSFMIGVFAHPASAAISDGANAVDLIGQYTDLTGDTVSYTKSGLNNGPNALGFQLGVSTGKLDMALDPVNHRMFITDTGNNRVLVFNLNGSNILVDKMPDYVLGQTDFYTGTLANTQSGLNTPNAVVFDQVTNRLFVAEHDGARVKVFDVSTVTSGQDATHVIGQTTFTGASSGNTQSSLNTPYDIALDSATNRLFVAERSGNRVKVFDVATSTIANGQNAINVLGQTTFTGASSGNTQSGLNTPASIDLDPVTNRLFVGEDLANRVKIFDIASITDGENAINILGQTTYTGTSLQNSQTGFNGIAGVAFDSTGNRLFVAEFGNRVKVFDVASTTNNEPAINILGQTTYTGSVADTNAQSSISSARSVSFDASNNLLYVSGSASRVKVFDVASITNGENAVDTIGHYLDTAGTVVSYTMDGSNNGPGPLGFYAPKYMLLDEVHHRLFVTERNSNRVLVFNLSVTNTLSDKIADYVLGQADFYIGTLATTQSGFNTPQGLALDPATNRLFVADQFSHRVMVFDVASITNGENAINVLGQTTFTGASSGNTQLGLNQPQDLAFDPGTNRLFVAESGGHRVKVFDVSTSTITNGQNAINVLGQTTFSGSTASSTQSGLNSPQGLAFDSGTDRLFVAEASGHRVKVFDVASITNGENAINVLGQTTFTGASSGNTQSGLNSPQDVTFDPGTDRLFVAEGGGHRVKVFDVASVTDGENAINVLGQTTFTGASSGNTQSGLNSPQGLAFDATANRLLVSESSGHRIKFFDVSVATPDTTPPSVSITAPTSGATVSGTTALSANASDAVGVSGVQFYVDSVARGSEDTVSAYSISFDTTGVADGAHTVFAVARDSAGNYATSSTVSFTVDNTVPGISTLSPADDASGVAIAADLVITFTTAVDVETGNIVIKNAVGDVVVESIDVTGGQVTGSGTDTITIALTANLAEGTTYYVQIDATAFDDTAGNSFAGIADTVTWNFATVAAAVTNANSSSGRKKGSSIQSRVRNLIESGNQQRATELMQDFPGVFASNTVPTVRPSAPLVDLTRGSIGITVTTLQQLLVLEDAGPAALALAAHGLTDYFGPLTHAALIEYQKREGITPAVGYFGPITRARLGL